MPKLEIRCHNYSNVSPVTLVTLEVDQDVSIRTNLVSEVLLNLFISNFFNSHPGV